MKRYLFIIVVNISILSNKILVSYHVSSISGVISQVHGKFQTVPHVRIQWTCFVTFKITNCLTAFMYVTVRKTDCCASDCIRWQVCSSKIWYNLIVIFTSCSNPNNKYENYKNKNLKNFRGDWEHHLKFTVIKSQNGWASGTYNTYIACSSKCRNTHLNNNITFTVLLKSLINYT